MDRGCFDFFLIGIFLEYFKIFYVVELVIDMLRVSNLFFKVF